MALERLDKLLSASGTVSRSEAKALVKVGRVSVDGYIPKSADEKFDNETATVYVDGEVVSCAAKRYIMMHKPGGILSATEDSKQETVIDLLTPQLKKQGLFPVGRLDKDTTGLLLLTNDGDFAHRVISPKKHVQKIYRAAVDGVLDESDIDAFAKGLVLSDGLECLPAKLEIVRPSVGLATVYEGKYHQVKRMFASRGKHVTALHRQQIGQLVLDKNLKAGEYRELSSAELELIFADEPQN